MFYLDELYFNVRVDLESIHPAITFNTPSASGTFCMQTVDDGRHSTHIILSSYSQSHPQVKKLGLLLKHCAKVKYTVLR